MHKREQRLDIIKQIVAAFLAIKQIWIAHCRLHGAGTCGAARRSSGRHLRAWLHPLRAARRTARVQGDSSIDTMHATLHADPPDVATLAAVPEPLSRIVTRCLEKQPANRFQTAAICVSRSTRSATAADAAPAAQRRPLSMMLVDVATVVIAALAVGGWSWRASPAASHPRSVPHARGIAVLPFENLGAAEQAYFAAGVTEEVTLQLAKVSRCA